jgi:hypothetical protein
MTPEGRIKKKIKALLDSYSDDLYVYMPVPSGYGQTAIDYLGCIRGVFFGVEAKRPGGKPTPRQEGALESIQRAGGAVFVIDDDGDLALFKRFLDNVMRMT